MRKMASPTSSTRRINGAGLRGFTLTELMISAVLSTIILAAVLSTFLMILRTGANASNYSELETEARQALEMFSREVRLANSVGSGYSSTSVTLGIPDTSSSRTAVAYSVTYAFDTTNKQFTRTGPPIDNPSGTSTTTVLVNNVQQIPGVNPFNYYRYVTTGGYVNGFQSNTAASAVEIKQIEINFVAQRTNTTVNTATNKVLSARFILRNK
jgi:prepilin-type N-terminal cleavage/methylation domain-containing protein